jgi:hypothetical protein
MRPRQRLRPEPRRRHPSNSSSLEKAQPSSCRPALLSQTLAAILPEDWPDGTGKRGSATCIGCSTSMHQWATQAEQRVSRELKAQDGTLQGADSALENRQKTGKNCLLPPSARYGTLGANE